MTPPHERALRLKHRLQQAKHRAFLAYKPYRFQVAGAVEPLYRAVHTILPDRFDPRDWPGTHLVHDEPLTRDTHEPVPRRIFCFWTGDNPLTPNRARGMETLRAHNPDLEVLLVTPDDLGRWLLPDEPLHPAYEHLSLIHRADYLSAYFLNFHGGGTCDIKPALAPWTSAFDAMDASDAWMAGYRVPVRLMGTNNPDHRLEKVMRRYSEQRLGQCAYIARPQTPLTREWWRELNRRLDDLADDLARHPGNERGDNADYPVMLNGLLAQVLDPLQVKYRHRLRYCSTLQPEFDDYI